MQLSLALEHTAQRKQAIHDLTGLLNDTSLKDAINAQYLQQALLCLTATEVVQLLNWPEVVKAPMTASW